jgi:hypothetical protein
MVRAFVVKYHSKVPEKLAEYVRAHASIRMSLNGVKDGAIRLTLRIERDSPPQDADRVREITNLLSDLKASGEINSFQTLDAGGAK